MKRLVLFLAMSLMFAFIPQVLADDFQSYTIHNYSNGNTMDVSPNLGGGYTIHNYSTGDTYTVEPND